MPVLKVQGAVANPAVKRMQSRGQNKSLNGVSGVLRVKKLISVIAIFCMANIAYAEQEIVGAFGVRLGDTVDDSMEFVEENDLGELIYEFTPEKPNDFFSEYRLFATHKTKKILRIKASHLYSSKDICTSKETIIDTALKKKYGANLPVIQDRRIGALCDCCYMGKSRLLIIYEDNSLEEQSKVEKAEELSDSL